MTLRRLAFVVALAATTTEVWAQRQPAPFRTGVEIVYLDVTVTAPDGSIVTGLTKDDFQIFDEGVRHDIAVFSDKPEPISLGILVDTSNSMTGDRIKAAIAAADAMGRALQPLDLWSVFAFSTRLSQLVGWRPYDPSVIKELKEISVGGGTELFKSVADMVPKFRDTSFRKRAMLVITDGADNAVQAGRPNRRGGIPSVGMDAGMPGEGMIDHTDKALKALQTGEVLVYGLGIGWAQSGGGNSDLHVPSLEKLANPTGGGVAVARRMADLQILARNLTDELRQQYTVGFSPLKAPDGKYRRLKVVAKNPAYTVRTRAGYLAKKP
jgi:Ca-activated chloride channel family protein